MRVALIHDWLVGRRGGEKVLESLYALYPQAEIFTLFLDLKTLSPPLQKATIHTVALLNILRPLRKLFLPLLPFFIERFDLSEFDLVISSSSCVAKGIIPKPGAVHISYIHSPMRYVWDQQKVYLPGGFLLTDIIASRLRLWDTVSSCRVTRFVANSHFVRQRVRSFYNRPATVVHPPIEECFYLKELAKSKKNYAIIAGAWVPYKGFEIAIDACRIAGIDLIIAGSGPLENKLRRLASKSVIFVKSPDQTSWMQLISEARLLLFPQIEDFGMTCAEAMALGTPVVAYRAGGALDMIVEKQNGLFFEAQTAKCLADAMKIAFDYPWDFAKIRESSMRFKEQVFAQKMRNLIEETLQKRDGFF